MAVVHRFIPARAGNTLLGSGPSSRQSVHPRPRGEHHVFRLSTYYFERFIPARAGNTQMVACWSCRCAGSSPPARGTRSLQHRGTSIWHGSSPPARGTHRHVQGTAWSSAVHPRPRGEHIAPPSCPVHPRPRGVTASAAHSPLIVGGSSPPARGTLTAGALTCCTRRRGSSPPARGTPTSVHGSTRPWSFVSVHPRPRGEHQPSTGDRRRS